MVDRRRYTETKTLQLAWSILALGVGGLGAVFLPGLVGPVTLAGWGAAWLLGLLALGYRERRHWQHLVARSAFEPGPSAGVADLQRTVHGHAVGVSTAVPGLLAGTQTVVSARSTGVDAEFTICLEHVGAEGRDASGDGVATGNPALDGAWIVSGGERNVDRLLSPDVQSALMDVTVPASVTVTGDRVALRVPFTRLSPSELAACAAAVGTIAARVEDVGRPSGSRSG
jgi:hypothetical protein